MSARIASLLPAATEILCALGARDELVGISHECDYPPGLAELPVLTIPRVEASSSSHAVDRAVRDVVRESLAVYDLDLELFERSRPDIVVTQDLCDVCAVSLSDVEKAVRDMTGGPVEIVSLAPRTLDDVLNDFVRVGDSLGRKEAAAELVREFRMRAEKIGSRVPAGPRPRVLSIEWTDPVMIGGMWMPELIEIAGGEALVTRSGEHAPTLDRDALRELSPDVVLIKPCGFSVERTTSEMRVIKELLDDVARPIDGNGSGDGAGRVFVADGNAYFNRPGPRLIDSIEILAACIWPGEFEDFRHQHEGSFVAVKTE